MSHKYLNEIGKRKQMKISAPYTSFLPSEKDLDNTPIISGN
jgi:hypothetical protein